MKPLAAHTSKPIMLMCDRHYTMRMHWWSLRWVRFIARARTGPKNARRNDTRGAAMNERACCMCRACCTLACCVGYLTGGARPALLSRSCAAAHCSIWECVCLSRAYVWSFQPIVTLSYQKLNRTRLFWLHFKLTQVFFYPPHCNMHVHYFMGWLYGYRADFCAEPD